MLPLELCKLFGSLSPGDLATLKSVANELPIPGGSEIFKEGDAGDALYAIAAGTVQISGVVAQGERQVFSRLPEGEVFGEMAVIDNQPRSATAVAEVDTVVYRIPREAMLSMLERSPQFSFSMMREITQRLREFNRQYLRRVIQAERMALVGRFASSIVHDLKNPLTIIGMAADHACEPNTSAEARKLAQTRIRKQVDRISTMLSDILEFTRGTNAQPALAVLDYAEFAQPVIDDIAKEIEPKGVVIEMAAPPPPVRVSIHPRRLSRVFYNLMFNAVDEMPEGGRIKLHFRITSSELITEFEDSGHGIAPEMLDKLFEAFATYGKTRGTGLGLSIAQRIVQEHQGRIYARNVPGSGALFGFTLPLTAAN
ncbi:MAG TPA: cyclic nucleotide-binding domain-containing protein [Candidatus Acidoferrum sp.]|nr:cyclic nucleotide-binding domain-containing protein [Candidatus Acidoferrum sp.]